METIFDTIANTKSETANNTTAVDITFTEEEVNGILARFITTYNTDKMTSNYKEALEFIRENRLSLKLLSLVSIPFDWLLDNNKQNEEV